LIEISHISKTFNKGKDDEVRALKDISLAIQEGDFIMIIGANGSGKSTFFNILQGSERSDSGQIMAGGKDITKWPEHKRSKLFSRVFQNPAQGTAPDLSILENFRLAALRSGQRHLRIGNNRAFRDIVKSSVETLEMGLENKLDRSMGSLSGGQRQALTLLMGVMDKTSLLLMDEPTAALDPRSAEKILQIANKLNKEKGLGIILITHSMKDAHQYGNRLIQFREGQIIRDLKKEEKEKLDLMELYNGM
jgi:putative ABC transport system ATP-binding protein